MCALATRSGTFPTWAAHDVAGRLLGRQTAQTTTQVVGAGTHTREAHTLAIAKNTLLLLQKQLRICPALIQTNRHAAKKPESGCLTDMLPAAACAAAAPEDCAICQQSCFTIASACSTAQCCFVLLLLLPRASIICHPGALPSPAFAAPCGTSSGPTCSSNSRTTWQQQWRHK